MSVSEYVADGGPVVCEQRGSRFLRCVANAFEDVEYLFVAVDVAFCDLPVVRARISRLARVADRNAFFEFGRVYC